MTRPTLFLPVPGSEREQLLADVRAVGLADRPDPFFDLSNSARTPTVLRSPGAWSPHGSRIGRPTSPLTASRGSKELDRSGCYRSR